MENTIVYNPTKLHFGKNVTEKLGNSVENYGKTVLLIYGGGSIKQNGIYEQVMRQLNSIGATVYEYSGITPNPVVEDVNAAASLGRHKEVDVILAVGGGSVIDASKIVSITIPVQHSCWDFMTDKAQPERSIPLIAILTLAATGTEMNRFAVVQNNDSKEKLGYGNPLIYPAESFLDPQYTESVPKDYTGYGVVDLTAHCLEAYFGEGDASLSDRFVYAIIREAMKYGVLLLDDLKNYGLREKIMYAATFALNNLTLYGRKSGDWGAHAIGHVLSVLYDVPHGASLSVAYPAWLKLQEDRIPGRITELGMNLFNTHNVDESVFELENFFASLDAPLRLTDLSIRDDKHEEIFKTMVTNGVGGVHHKLSENDYRKLIELMA